MNYRVLLARRYLKPPKGNIFQLFITFLSIGGIMVGVATLITVTSIMNGLHNDIKNKIIGVNAHIIITQGVSMPDSAKQEIVSIINEEKYLSDNVIGMTPFVFSKVMIKRRNLVDGVMLRGCEIESSHQVINIDSSIVEGSFLGVPQHQGVMPVVMGVMLAEAMELEVGDVFEIYSILTGTMTPIGPVPKVYKAEVVGLVDIGLYEYNSSWIFTTLPDAQKIMKLNAEVTGFQLAVKNVLDSRKISNRLQQKLGYQYVVQDWLGLNKNLFSALKLEKIVMMLVVFLIVVVAAFNIISTLIMIVMQKTREIGILRSIGVRKVDVVKIFIYQGTILGIIGTILGVGSGLLLCWILGKYKFPIDTDVYIISSLPIMIDYLDVLIISIASVLVSFMATLYPAFKASKLVPVEAIRYE
ncbi:MAG: FtsX-like permease family protein [bacterium]